MRQHSRSARRSPRQSAVALTPACRPMAVRLLAGDKPITTRPPCRRRPMQARRPLGAADGACLRLPYKPSRYHSPLGAPKQRLGPSRDCVGGRGSRKFRIL